MDKIIPFNKGIRRQPSLGEAGELSELVNLVPKNGELVNVRGMEAMAYGLVHPTGNYIIRAIHHVDGNVFYISSEDNTLSIKREEGENFTFNFSSNITNVSTVGNVVVVSCEYETSYLLYRGGSYIDLGSGFPEIPFVFGLVSKKETYSDTQETSNKNLAESLLSSMSKKGYTAPFFVRCAIELYDQSLVSISAPVLMIAATKDEVVVANNIARCFLHQLVYKCYDESFSEKVSAYQDIISSINIYATRGISLFDKGMNAQVNDSSGFSYSGELDFKIDGNISFNTKFQEKLLYEEGEPVSRYRKSNREIKEDVDNISSFYLIKKIEPNDIKDVFTLVEFNPDINEGVLETMGDDYRSVAKFSASNLLSYNSRLIASNISGWLFDGYPIKTIFPAGRDDAPFLNKYEIYYHIVEGGNEVIVKGADVKLAEGIPFRFLYYPSRNANRATIVKDDDQVFQVQLKPHKYLYGSYYFEGFDSPMLTDGALIDNAPSYNKEATKVLYPNQLFFTNVNNPFNFKQEFSISVGSSEIVGMSTSAKALSQGQFGQFPLYVFCTDGIWALEVANDGTFSARQPISRDVCNNPNSITQIDGAVVFTTDQGLKMIQGSDVVLLSGHMDGYNVDEGIYFNKGFFDRYENGDFDKLVVSEHRDIRDIFKTCKISYDYVNQILRIFPDRVDGNKPYKYYIFSLSTSEFSTATGHVIGHDTSGNLKWNDQFEDGKEIVAVVPDYPSGYIQIDNRLYRQIENLRDGHYNGLLLTRPIMFDEPSSLKKLQELKLHYAKLNEDTFAKLVIFVSDDGHSWKEITSLRGRAYKYFRFGVITHMKDDEALSGLVTRYSLERTNKLR